MIMLERTIDAMLADAAEHIDSAIAESRARTLRIMKEHGATEAELAAIAAWLDDEHDTWRDEALTELRAKFMEATADMPTVH